MPWQQLPTAEDIGTTLKGMFLAMFGLFLTFTIIFIIYEVSGRGAAQREKDAEKVRQWNIERIEREIKALEAAEVSTRKAKLEVELERLRNGSK